MKAIFFYFCMIAAAAAQNGPTAEWMLTQGPISGTAIADSSGNGNVGAAVNGPLTFGVIGANFNGQQYIDSPLNVASPALSVSIWFNAANLSNANPRLVANSHTDIDAKGFQLMFNSGGASGFFDVGNGTAEGRASWSQQLLAGTWYHYVGVYDGSTVKAYINGSQVASTAFAGGAVAAGTGPHINVARNPAYGRDFFAGAAWDVRIYERAISAAEILALYQARQTCPVGTYMTSNSPFSCVPVQGVCSTPPVVGSACSPGDSCFLINRTTTPAQISMNFCDGKWIGISPIIGQTQ